MDMIQYGSKSNQTEKECVMFKFILVRFAIACAIVGVVGVILYGVYQVDMTDLDNQMSLINPPVEIMNGQVRTTEITIIHYYNEGDESKRVVFITCSGEELTFSVDQTEVILRYLGYQETGCP